MLKNDLLELIYKAIDEVNKQLDKDSRLVKANDTIIFGKDGKLDSLGLVNFIVALEENINDELGTEILLADEHAMTLESSPFRTVDTLADYILGLLEEHGNE